MFLPYALLSNCYLVTFFFIRIIHEKFELTSHTDSCSFANITRTLLGWLHTCLIVILLLSRKNRVQIIFFRFMLPPTGMSSNFNLFTYVIDIYHMSKCSKCNCNRYIEGFCMSKCTFHINGLSPNIANVILMS